jgi:hypothetical protein
VLLLAIAEALGSAAARAETTVGPAPPTTTTATASEPPPPSPDAAGTAGTRTAGTGTAEAPMPHAGAVQGFAIGASVEAPRGTAVVLPSVTPAADCTACPAIHRPDPERERELSLVAKDLDSVIADAAQDLGLTLDVSGRPTEMTAPPTEAALIGRAGTGWVFSPRLAFEGARVAIRIVAVAPGSRVVLVRSETLAREDIEVRTVLMMRDLVHAARTERPTPIPAPQADEHAVVRAARSRGRAVLALNAAVLGGYAGFALQRAGGSTDARLTYPLIALGTGLGLGSSMIVADEWDVGLGDAWYMSAGMWWPTLGALLVARDEKDSKRFLYGAGAAAFGMVLATTSLTFGGMSEGNALVAHSGGAFGTLLGGITDLAVRGRTDVTPTEGMGIGAISGVVLAGALARFTPSQPPSRVLFVDLSAGLGALTGAAVASPLVFGESVGPTRNRIWLSTIALGTFVGAGVGIFTTRGPQRETHEAGETRPSVVPYAGVIASSQKPDGSSVPVTGAGVRGIF